MVTGANFEILGVGVWGAVFNLLVWVIGIFWVSVAWVNWLLMILDVLSIRLLVAVGIFDVDLIELGVAWFAVVNFEVKTQVDGGLAVIRVVWAPELVFKFIVDGTLVVAPPLL